MNQRLSLTTTLLMLVGGILLGFSQPVVIESFKPEPLDSSGLTGLLALIGWAPYFYAMNRRSVKASFWWGALVGTIQHSIIFYWIAIAVSVFGHLPWVLGIFLTVLLSFVVSAIGAAGLAFAQHIALKNNWPSYLVMPFGLAAFEFMRNYAPFGGYPWGMLGNSMATIEVLRAGAAYIGSYGLLIIILCVNASIAAFFQREADRLIRKRFIATTVGACVLWLVIGSFHIGRLETAHTSFKAGLLQGNIEQGIKNSARQNRFFIMKRYHDIQDVAIDKGADVLVWPEAAIPQIFQEDMKLFSKRVLQGDSDKDLPPSFVGGLSKDFYIDPYTLKKELGIYNAVYLTDATRHIQARFNKVHLVPFGEYVPWPFSFLVATVVPTPVLPGEKTKPAEMTIAGQSYQVVPTVCYEGVFPEITREYTAAGAELFFNMTNDAWYGISSAPFQHFLMYSMRSAESGRPYIRVANTGVSGWVDALGNVHDLSQLYETTAHIVHVNAARIDTFFVKAGYLVPILNLLFFLALLTHTLMGGLRNVFNRKALPLFCIVLSVGLTIYHVSQLGESERESSATIRQLLMCAAWLMGIFFAQPSYRLGKILRNAFFLSGILGIVMMLVSALVYNNPSKLAFINTLCSSGLLFYLSGEVKRLKRKSSQN